MKQEAERLNKMMRILRSYTESGAANNLVPLTVVVVLAGRSCHRPCATEPR